MGETMSLVSLLTTSLVEAAEDDDDDVIDGGVVVVAGSRSVLESFLRFGCWTELVVGATFSLVAISSDEVTAAVTSVGSIGLLFGKEGGGGVTLLLPPSSEEETLTFVDEGDSSLLEMIEAPTAASPVVLLL